MEATFQRSVNLGGSGLAALVTSNTRREFGFTGAVKLIVPKAVVLLTASAVMSAGTGAFVYVQHVGPCWTPVRIFYDSANLNLGDRDVATSFVRAWDFTRDDVALVFRGTSWDGVTALGNPGVLGNPLAIAGALDGYGNIVMA